MLPLAVLSVDFDTIGTSKLNCYSMSYSTDTFGTFLNETNAIKRHDQNCIVASQEQRVSFAYSLIVHVKRVPFKKEPTTRFCFVNSSEMLHCRSQSCNTYCFGSCFFGTPAIVLWNET